MNVRHDPTFLERCARNGSSAASDVYKRQSQYDATGKVVRGPAPLSLALANVSVENDNVFVSQWTETDFRTGDKPWWA